MNRADFWCRVLAWLQICGALATAAAIYLLWSVFIGMAELDAGSVFMLDVFKWIIIGVMALPPLLAGFFTWLFAGHVETARNGIRAEQHVLLRVLMALSGLWSAGVIGFLGFSIPPISFFAVLGVASAVLAIMGQDWTADLINPPAKP